MDLPLRVGWPAHSPGGWDVVSSNRMGFVLLVGTGGCSRRFPERMYVLLCMHTHRFRRPVSVPCTTSRRLLSAPGVALLHHHWFSHLMSVLLTLSRDRRSWETTYTSGDRRLILILTKYRSHNSRPRTPCSIWSRGWALTTHHHHWSTDHANI